MPNVIDFLEWLGQDARLRHAASSELERALAAAQIEPAARAAILGADSRDLERLLGVNASVCCIVYAPEQEEEPEGDEPGDGDGDGDEGEESGEPSRRPASSRVGTAP